MNNTPSCEVHEYLFLLNTNRGRPTGHKLIFPAPDIDTAEQMVKRMGLSVGGILIESPPPGCRMITRDKEWTDEEAQAFRLSNSDLAQAS